MMSFLLSTVIIYLLWEYRRGRDRLWLIPVVMVVWANLHGGFAIGFVLLVLATAGEGLRWFFGAIGGETLEDAELDARFRRVLRLVAVGLISAAVVSINPYGPRMLLYPFQTVGIKVLRDFIQEWAAPNFHEAQTWPFIWLLLATFVAVGVSPRRLDWRDAVMLGGTAYSALLAGRNIATFAVVATPALAYYADPWLEQIGVRFKLNRPPRGAAAGRQLAAGGSLCRRGGGQSRAGRQPGDAQRRAGEAAAGGGGRLYGEPQPATAAVQQLQLGRLPDLRRRATTRCTSMGEPTCTTTCCCATTLPRTSGSRAGRNGWMLSARTLCWLRRAGRYRSFWRRTTRGSWNTRTRSRWFTCGGRRRESNGGHSQPLKSA